MIFVINLCAKSKESCVLVANTNSLSLIFSNFIHIIVDSNILTSSNLSTLLNGSSNPLTYTNTFKI